MDRLPSLWTTRTHGIANGKSIVGFEASFESGGRIPPFVLSDAKVAMPSAVFHLSRTPDWAIYTEPFLLLRNAQRRQA
jgi:hypothetical protein